MKNRIREWRKRRRFSAKRLGELIPMDNEKGYAEGPTISRLENGEMELTLTWMGKLATALKIKIRDLIVEGESAQAMQLIKIVATAKINLWGNGVVQPAEKLEEFEIPAVYIEDRDATFGVLLDDDHANKKYPRGAILICKKVAEKAQDLIINEFYIVERVNDEGRIEVSVRRLIQTSEGRLYLVTDSNNPSDYSSIFYSPANPALQIAFQIVRFIGK